jgi:DNA-binding beta-propeller fold protein YncE
MAPVNELLNPTHDDLIALSYYINDLVGKDVNAFNMLEIRGQLAQLTNSEPEIEYVASARDQLIDQVAPFETVLNDWKRHAKTGSLKRSYEMVVVSTFDAGEPQFTPEPGKTYFYESLDTPRPLPPGTPSGPRNKTNTIAVGDAATGEIITYKEMPPALKGQVHTTVLSPDGKYVYITGPAAKGASPGLFEIFSPASLVKVDALTLQPIKHMISDARLHHAQIFQDKYIQMDTFARQPDGLDIFHLDPNTDEVVGGIRCEDLGGSCYTSYTDDEHIYILMQPTGYGPAAYSGFLGALNLVGGKLTVLKPFWVAKLDPESWEVIREYPYPGYRGDWLVIDSKKEFMYVPATGSSNISKINMDTGEIVWVSGTGPGPYGASLNADETEIWVADKGESHMLHGRTISVFDTVSGAAKHTLFSGYGVDHVLLAPNGKEFWGTSNVEGKVYVFDAQTHEQKRIINMPGAGNPHGSVWVHYDMDGTARVVRDQGGFHNGIHPARGRVLEY